MNITQTIESIKGYEAVGLVNRHPNTIHMNGKIQNKH